MNYEKVLDDAAFALVTPITMHEDIKEYLEGFLGAGTVVINS